MRLSGNNRRIYRKALINLLAGGGNNSHRYIPISLYAPMPGIAVHLSDGHLDSVIDWEKRFTELKV
tara:strand:- start:471 stop:668 length:198 start_codon:yes stop_codon:yes gene_type:complete